METETRLTPAEQRKAEADAEEKLRKRGELVRASPSLLPYGTPQELMEMFAKVKYMVPGADKLKPNELWALVQASFALGLNPIISECFWIPGSGFMPGIKGLRRLGRNQFTKRDAHEDLHLELITSKEDFEAYKIPLGALAFFCKGTVSDKRRAQAEDAETWRKALGPDAPYEEILKRVGPPTETVGIGFVTAEQMEEMDNPRWHHVCKKVDENLTFAYGKKQRELWGQDPCPDCDKKSFARVNAMPHTQRAQKRAESHWWKQECDLPFNIQPGVGGLAEDLDIDGTFPDMDPDTIEGAFLPESLKTGEEVETYRELQKESDKHAEELDELDREELKARAEQAAKDLFGGQVEEPPKNEKDVETGVSFKRPMSPEALKVALVNRSEEIKETGMSRIEKTKRGMMVGVINQIFAGPNADDDRHAFFNGVFDEKSSKKLKAYQVLAVLKWLNTVKDSGDAYVPDKTSAVEAVAFVDHLIETEQYDRGSE